MSTSLSTGPWPANEIIRASAGSGKTYQLCLRYLQLLQQGAPCQAILAMTFTRKAAAEILDRVAQVLAAAAHTPAQAATIATHLGDPSFDQSRARQLLRQLVSNLHRLQIGTLDSFYSRLSRANSLELGLQPQWEIGDTPTLARLRQQAISRVLAHDQTPALLRLMAKGEVHRNVNDLLLNTVEHLYEIYLDSLPGAWDPFPADYYPPASELAEILDALAAVELSGAVAKTRDSDLEKARGGDWSGLAGAGIFAKVAAGETTYSRRAIPADLLAVYRRLVSYAQAAVRWQLRESTLATFELLQQFDQQLVALKHQAGVFEFGDVTRWLAAEESPGAAASWARRSDITIDHLLLDEFQDTAPAQWRILRPFARYVSEPRAPRTFFCVGDLKQAIYGWRGGVAEVFELVESELPGLQLRDLTTSYRSAQVVIDTVNRVFLNLDKFRSNDPDTNDAVHHWGERFREHSTARDLSGYCELRAVDHSDQAPESLIEYLVATLQPILASQPQLSVGILTYQNAEIPPIIAGLRRAGLAASEEGGTPLDDSAVVDLVLALLHLADHPADTRCWFHLAGSPLAGPLGIPPFEPQQRDRESPPAAVHAYAASLRRELTTQGYSATLGRWAKLAAPWCTLHELRRLQQLVELADEFDEQAGLRTADFAAQVAATRIEDPSTAGIRVMTIHKAKGLEFDVVIVPWLKKALAGQGDEVIVHRRRPTDPISLVCRRAAAELRGLLPAAIGDAFRQQRARLINEALCVLYVALTRARRGLYLLVNPKQGAGNQSPGGILLATLGGEQGAASSPLVYAHGDPLWYQTAAAAASTPDGAAAGSAAVFYLRATTASPVPRLTTGQPQARHQRGRAPSRREGTGPRRGAELFAAERGDHALTRGQLLHALLAQIDWLEGVALPPPVALERVRSRCPDPQLWHNGLAELQRLLRQPGVASWFHRHDYLTRVAAHIPAATCAFDALSAVVETERPFAVRDEQGAVITGVFDRCLQVFCGGRLQWVDVVDFKTDAIDRQQPADVADHTEFYRPQVAAYRQAAAQVFHVPLAQVGGTLLFTAIDLAVDVR